MTNRSGARFAMSASISPVVITDTRPGVEMMTSPARPGGLADGVS
jgi:hypothetical protein